MKLVGNIFRLGQWSSVALFLTLSLAFLTVWAFPGLLINPVMLHRALPYFSKANTVRWKEIDLSAESLSFFKKKIHLRSKEICYENGGAEVAVCFGSADINLEVDIKSWLPTYRLGPVSLLDGSLKLKARIPTKEKSNEQKSFTGVVLPAPPEFLRRVALHSATVEIKQLEYLSEGLRITGSARLLTVGPDQRGQLDLVAEAAVLSGKETYRTNAEFHLQSLRSVWFGPYAGAGLMNGRLPGGKKINGDFTGTAVNHDEISYVIHSLYQEGRKNISLVVEGKSGLAGLSGLVSGKAAGFAGEVGELTLDRCPFFYKQKNIKADIAHAGMECAFVVSSTYPNKITSVYQSFLRTLRINLKAEIDLPLGDSQKEMDGHLNLVMDSQSGKINYGHGSFETRFHGRLDDFPKRLDLDTSLAVDIPEFQNVVKMLSGFPWSIPDPFRTLEGTINLDVRSNGKVGNEIRLPVKFATQLHSKEQSLVVDGNGALKISDLGRETSHLHFDFKVMLSDIRLVLPYLSVSAPPRLVPDSRIKVAPKPSRRPVVSGGQPASSGFTYDIQMVTPADKPFRLVSNLAKSEIPLAIEARSTSEHPAAGSMRIANFGLQLFRRNATVDHFDLLLLPDSDDVEVNGEIHFPYTDYTVKVLILGLAKNPEIKFLSEPPLPEKEVMAILLFGKKIEALDAEQSGSVLSTRSAVADGAVSLASMYLLASTPVQSVGYDPNSGAFNAKVQLADGTSLTVGSNFSDAEQIGVRRQLRKNLYLDTNYISQAAQTAKNKLQTFLQWSKGY